MFQAPTFGGKAQDTILLKHLGKT